MLRPRPACAHVAAVVVALALAAPAGAAVTSWQTCSVAPGGDTALCTSGGFPHEIVSAAGALWVTTANDEILRVSAAPATRGAITLFPIPEPTPSLGPGRRAGTHGLVVGPDGALRFSQERAMRLGRVDTAGAFSFTPLGPVGDLRITGTNDVTLGPDGAFWATRYPGPAISRIATDGTVTDFRLRTMGPGEFVSLQDIVSGPRSRLWFTDSGIKAIGSITTTGEAASFRRPVGLESIYNLVAGPDGAIWFTSATSASPRRGIVGRLSPDGTYRLFDTGAFLPRAIHRQGDQLWLGSDSTPGPHALLRMTTSGVVTHFEPLLFRPGVSDITTGPDGAIWFLDAYTALVGRIDPGSAPAAGDGPTPVEIDPASLEVTATGATVDVASEVDADLEVRAVVPAAPVAAGAATRTGKSVKTARLIRVPRVRTAGSTKVAVTPGKRTIAVKLSAADRRALRRGTRLRVAVRATETSKRKTLVQANLRAG